MKEYRDINRELQIKNARNRALILAAALERAQNDEDFWTAKLKEANDSASLEETKRILEKKLEDVKEFKIRLVETEAEIRLIEKNENQWKND